MKKLLLSAIMIAVVTSCTKEANKTEEPLDKVIQANSSITNTKAIITETNEFTFTYLKAEDESASVVSAIKFNESSAGTSLHATGGKITFKNSVDVLKYGKDNKTVYFKCFYPEVTPSTDKLSWTVNGITDILISDAWSAGNYSNPITTGLIFEHALAKLEIQAVAKTGQDVLLVNDAWGKILKIEVTNLSNELIYTPSTNVISYGVTNVATALNDTYDVLGYTASVIPTTAIAMLATSNTASKKAIVLKVTTEKDGSGSVVETATNVNVTLAQDFVAGSKYIVKLLFAVNDKPIPESDSKITDWGNDVNGAGETDVK